MKRANAKTLKGDFEGAINDLTKVIEINPKNAMAYRLRAMAREKQGDIKGSEEDLRKMNNLFEKQ